MTQSQTITVTDVDGSDWTINRDRITAVKWFGSIHVVSCRAHVLLAGRELKPVELGERDTQRLWRWYATPRTVRG